MLRADRSTLNKDQSRREASLGQKYIHVYVTVASDFSIILPVETTETNLPHQIEARKPPSTGMDWPVM
ncbi:hypothetical protein EN974_29505 [Mesorhizobium sp. M7A.F.Ca.CA.001.12.2.1]|nr:hypothetical protein EN974_29505 [Mesorhizobium sp. M7A.F.Ca.CA.001.12.2.1]RUZ30309.1 hypothetical protein EN949_01555 [Mesorhizobium sp. M7A.F.Ca.US.007.01.2.1]RUZ44792.1 hypothetical protein EN948_21765 [Mesorhizobium sp. M7A.F.Ca.US.003.02.1.1]RUZ58857.1 hypothetical protein EN950_23185 [Mesorhizobium sp. M7A.F.Ca.US.007.01.1.1]RUZ81636.1 hypothetical protein EN947_19340 [Mesorhizobium sp. M7A.F.Ca.US.003.02.2.1]